MKKRTRILLALAIVGALGAQTKSFRIVIHPTPQEFELTTRSPEGVKRGGIPLPEVTTDFYGRPRDPLHPSMGAFEWPAGMTAKDLEAQVRRIIEERTGK